MVYNIFRLSSWFYGSWFHGFIVYWFHGFIVSWFHGFMMMVDSLIASRLEGRENSLLRILYALGAYSFSVKSSSKLKEMYQK